MNEDLFIIWKYTVEYKATLYERIWTLLFISRVRTFKSYLLGNEKQCCVGLHSEEFSFVL